MNKNIQKDAKTQTQIQEQIQTQEINVKITESSENSLSQKENKNTQITYFNKKCWQNIQIEEEMKIETLKMYMDPESEAHS